MRWSPDTGKCVLLYDMGRHGDMIWLGTEVVCIIHDSVNIVKEELLTVVHGENVMKNHVNVIRQEAGLDVEDFKWEFNEDRQLIVDFEGQGFSRESLKVKIFDTLGSLVTVS